MRKFIVSILCAVVFFIGLGGLIENAGARFKSDERALDLIKQARAAIGGETAVRGVKSLSITARVAKTFDFDGTAPRIVSGDLEINLQMPDQFSKRLNLRHENDAAEAKPGESRKRIKVVALEQGDAARISVDNENADGSAPKITTKAAANSFVNAGNFHRSELFRTTFALLLTAPPETTFTYAGEGEVDGNACDIVEAGSGDSTVRLYLDKSSHLPRMLVYQSAVPRILRTVVNLDEKITARADQEKIHIVKSDGEHAMTEYQIKFSDYRNTGGIQLPYQWTQTVAGSASETVDVTKYEINPANIAEKFQNAPPRVLFRTEKKSQQ